MNVLWMFAMDNVIIVIAFDDGKPLKTTERRTVWMCAGHVKKC